MKKSNYNEIDTNRQDRKIILSGIFEEGFGIVPKLLVKSRDLSLMTKMVLCYLLAYTGSGKECWPSHAEIIKNLGISARTLRRSINEAMTKGFISRTRKFSRGSGSRNIYQILFMDGFRTATRAPSKKKKVPSCPLEGTPEHLPYNKKQYKQHPTGKSRKNSIYPDMEPLQ